MKNKLITGIFYTIAGILYIVGPYTIFRVCDSSKHIMKCHWTVQAEIGTGILFILLGVLFLFIDHKETIVAGYIVGIFNSVIAILYPLVLIGGCENSMMACKSLTFPSFYLIAALILIYSTTKLLLLYREKVKDGKNTFEYTKKELT